MSKGLFGLILALTFSAFFAGGCGSSNGGAATGSSTDTAGHTGPSLTRAEFVKKGDSICTAAMTEKSKLLKAALAVQSKSKKTPTQADQEKLVTGVALPPIAQMVDDLGALTPPKGDEETVGALLESLEKAIEEVEAEPTAALNSTTDPFLKSDKLTSAYGLQACGEL